MEVEIVAKQAEIDAIKKAKAPDMDAQLKAVGGVKPCAQAKLQFPRQPDLADLDPNALFYLLVGALAAHGRGDDARARHPSHRLVNSPFPPVRARDGRRDSA